VVSAHTASLRLGLDRLLNMVSLRGSNPPSKAIPVNPPPEDPATSRSAGRTSHSQEPKSKTELLRSIRIWLSLFIAGLILSGITAFPLEQETAWLADFAGRYSLLPNDITLWLDQVHTALHANSVDYPFLAYGTDWLAFAHLVLAIVFLGPLREPVRNKWVLQFGVIACIAVIPFALITGPIRGIPLNWRLIDCSFGVFGAIPLLICLNRVKRLEQFEQIVLTLNPADFHNDPPTAFR
jgi:hypothetical protein